MGEVIFDIFGWQPLLSWFIHLKAGEYVILEIREFRGNHTY